MSRRRRPYFWLDAAFNVFVARCMGILLAIDFDVQPPWFSW